MSEDKTFPGFVAPKSNFYKTPNVWIDLCSEINNLAELKVVQYVLRHTWGYQEYDITKTITIDEFMYGRKHNDGTRMDKGTGLSKQSVVDGTRKAIEDRYLICQIDDSDKARIKKSYALNMQNGCLESRHQVSKTLTPAVKNSDSSGLNTRQRSEKDTNRKTLYKDTNRKKWDTPSVSETKADSTSSSQNTFLSGLSPEARKVHEEWSKMPWFPSNGMGETVTKTLASQYEIAAAYKPTAEIMLKVKEWATSLKVDKKRYYADKGWCFKFFLNELPGWLSTQPTYTNQQDESSINTVPTKPSTISSKSNQNKEALLAKMRQKVEA